MISGEPLLVSPVVHTSILDLMSLRMLHLEAPTTCGEHHGDDIR